VTLSLYDYLSMTSLAATFRFPGRVEDLSENNHGHPAIRPYTSGRDDLTSGLATRTLSGMIKSRLAYQATLSMPGGSRQRWSKVCVTQER
jgi:hypothetical protein